MTHRLPGFWCDLARSLAACIVFTCCIKPAHAMTSPSIPPGFLAYPPYSGFVWEATHLLPKPTDHFLVVEAEDDTLWRGMFQVSRAESLSDSYSEAKLQDNERAAQLRLTAVPAKFASEFKAMQSAMTGDAAYQVGKDLPPAIRLYTAAAVDFHIAHPISTGGQPDFVWPRPPAQGPMNTREVALERAIVRFQAVLGLSNSEQVPRAVMAAYMLGRSYALRGTPDDIPKAEQAFALTRQLVRAHMPDPDGLAVASYGDQARLERAQGNLGEAVRLYAEQAAHGSVEGVESLKWVAQAVYQDPQGMSNAEDLPLVQRILIAYALEVNDDARLLNYTYVPGVGTPVYGDLYHSEGIAPILEIAKQWPRAKVAWPARLAALAYREGDSDFARSLITNQNTALAWWLRAKFLIADGKLAEAQAAYQKTVSMIPGNFGGQKSLSPFNGSGACAELTQLERARGEFVQSLTDMVACDRKYDEVSLEFRTGAGEYLAERVLTTEELLHFVDTLPVDNHKSSNGPIFIDRTMLRSELAKRLIREGRLAEAISYAPTQPVSYNRDDASFDTGLTKNLKTQKDLIKAYVTAYYQSEHAEKPVERGAAWYQLALLTRVHYNAITGHDSPLYTDEAEPLYPGVSLKELKRLKENYVTPDQDNLHWYTAYNDALKAAALVPARSQAYAAILCHAAHWMYQAPPVGDRNPQDIFRTTYQLYLKNGAYVAWGRAFGRHCPDPNFVAAGRPSWLRELSSIRLRAHRHPTLENAAIVLLALGMILLGSWFVVRSRRQQTK